MYKGRVDYEKDYAIITFESMMTDSDKKVGLLFEENGEISISWDHTNLQVIQFHFAQKNRVFFIQILLSEP